ncbi:hypothetical protein K491DRAFT_699850 [Lophiostoma macrostomum CBS 122681]|uniref:Uncharacterized protein n=1 Tax=Lophiostoma macrostomum CBS 122681 TaxID=1314788 RepID=A0A6A6SKE8_9PLEO|nr:hypothetical protein K491DRAFT_699850 [Lophiostoma macrostomum CBS 122681]
MLPIPAAAVITPAVLGGLLVLLNMFFPWNVRHVTIDHWRGLLATIAIGYLIRCLRKIERALKITLYACCTASGLFGAVAFGICGVAVCGISNDWLLLGYTIIAISGNAGDFLVQLVDLSGSSLSGTLKGVADTFSADKEDPDVLSTIPPIVQEIEPKCLSADKPEALSEYLQLRWFTHIRMDHFLGNTNKRIIRL